MQPDHLELGAEPPRSEPVERRERRVDEADVRSEQVLKCADGSHHRLDHELHLQQHRGHRRLGERRKALAIFGDVLVIPPRAEADITGMESAAHLQHTRVLDHASRLLEDGLAGLERSHGGCGEQLGIGHALPQHVGEARGHLVVVQHEVTAGALVLRQLLAHEERSRADQLLYDRLHHPLEAAVLTELPSALVQQGQLLDFGFARRAAIRTQTELHDDPSGAGLRILETGQHLVLRHFVSHERCGDRRSRLSVSLCYLRRDFSALPVHDPTGGRRFERQQIANGVVVLPHGEGSGTRARRDRGFTRGS